jgi:T-complex protein 1 subunit theta
MIVKVTSKFELKRICKALGAVPKASFEAPAEDEIGICDSATVQEIGSTRVTVLKRSEEDCKLSTIVLRGATNNYLDDIERAIEDGVSTYRNMVVSGDFVYGAGAIEAILA